MVFVLVAALPADAQQRVVVVPAGADVVIPPRGAAGPALVHAPRPRIAPPGRGAARPVRDSGGGLGGIGLAAPAALIALPIAMAAIMAGSVPGSSSSTSAPTRTR